MLKLHITYLALMVCLLAACHKTAPQRPTSYSHNATEVDSATLRLLHFSLRMADAADAELSAWVQRDTTYTWSLRDFGAWQRRDGVHAEDTILLENGETVSIHMRIHRLDGSLIIDTQQQHTMGDSRLPIGIESALREMVAGETRLLAIPWYVGYGVQGNEKIDQYENIIVEITLL